MNDGRSLTGAFGTCEQPILFSQGDGTNAVFDGVVVDRQIAGFGITRQRGLAFQAVINRFGSRTVGRDAQAGLL